MRMVGVVCMMGGKVVMIEALTLRVLEDGIRAEIMIEALTLKGLEDGI